MQFTRFCRDFDLVAKYAFSHAPSCTNFLPPGSASDSRTGPLTPRSSEKGEGRKIMLKRKPSEDMQKELARPLKKFKGTILSKDDVGRNDRVSMDLEQVGSNVSEGSEGRRIGPPGNERALLQVLGPDQERREILKKRFEIKKTLLMKRR